MLLIEIYSREGCGACDTAKKLLNEKQVEFVEYIVDKDITRDAVLEKFPGNRMLPIIVVEGRQVKDVESFKLLLEG